MNTPRDTTDPMFRLLDAQLAPSARDAAIDALLADREALARMKLALAFAPATESFVRSAQALPAKQSWFLRWQLWFGPVAAAAAIYAVVGGLSRPDIHDSRMAEAITPQAESLAQVGDQISGGNFETGNSIFRQAFD